LLTVSSALLAALLLSAPVSGQDTFGTVRKALDSPDSARQRAALVLIPELGLAGEREWEMAKSVTEYLGRAANDENKALALIALGSLQPAPKAASAILQKYLGDPSPVVRRAAGRMLVDLLARLTRDFGKPLIIVESNPTAVSFAAGTAAGSVWMQQWMNATVGKSADWKRFGEVADTLLPFCVIALTDSDEKIKQSGAEGIRLVARTIVDVLPDPNSGNAESRIVDPFESKVKWVLLQDTFDAVNRSAPYLVEGMNSPEFETRSKALRAAEAVSQARALALATRLYPPGDIGMLTRTPYPEDALKSAVATLLPAIARRLDDESVDLQLLAIEALELQQSASLPYLSAIIRASQHQDLFVRWVATRTLGRLAAFASPRDTPLIVSAIIPRLADSDLGVRGAALTAIGRTGKNGQSATRALLQLAGNDDPNQRERAIRTLATIDAERGPTLQALGNMLATAPDNVQKAAVFYLASLGHEARSVVPQLKPLLLDNDADVRKEAARAILAIE